MQKKVRWARIFWTALLLTGGTGLLLGWLYVTWIKIPSSIRIRAGMEQELSLDVPVLGEVYAQKEAWEQEAVPASGMHAVTASRPESIRIDLAKPVTVRADQIREYRMDVKLFGVIPFKTVKVEVIDDRKVIPSGMPIGIYVKTEGIMVIAEGEFEGEDGAKKEPARHLLHAGDYILKVNGTDVTTKADFLQTVADTEGKELILTIRRENEIFDIKIKPEKNADGAYKLGIWIRDNAQGVGTMTYLEEDNSFGALGHGINDADTALLMHVKSGSLYRTEIISIKKGEGGVPGELTGIIDYNKKNRIGVIDNNEAAGIFGELNGEKEADFNSKAVPIGLKQEVETGPAQIQCCVDGQSVPTLYQAEITNIHLDHDNINRGLELKITDPALLEKTGGIVQGMGVIDNRDNTRKPENMGFSAVTLNLTMIQVSDQHRHIRVDVPL